MSPARRCFFVASVFSLAGMLSSCALLPFGHKKPEPAKLPDTRGWGLMMDPTLTGHASVAAQGAAMGGTGAPSADGGTPSATAGGLYDFSSVTGNASAVTSRVPWIKSAMDATELSRRSGKPLLILVNNRNSPSGQSIESTLVLQPDFKKLAEETYIPLRMDFADESTTKSDFYQAFKDQLKVRGYPALLVMLPDGTEVLRLSGYKHEYEVPYMLRLRESVASCKKAVDARRKKLEPAGYRGWTDKKGVLVFAKLEKADANMLHLTTEWGTKFTTFTNRLSDADQEWIAKKQAEAAASGATASASL
ncbi:MAG: hypothetical protein ACAI34_05530 [Verrucomicrobium sp.]|nr:hypothetical protein [Verrucomicrobium sp.]